MIEKRKKKIVLPEGEQKLLLLSCCAPCSAETMQALKDCGIEVTIFFYNPNIHPFLEYEKRRDENLKFAQKLSIPFVEGEYDEDRWSDRTLGLEDEPEKGKRCFECFKLRLEVTAKYAQTNGFTLFSSILGISRWKDMDQVNGAGIEVAEQYPDLNYWTYNWRSDGGGSRMYQFTKEEGFYQQKYCGCRFSVS